MIQNLPQAVKCRLIDLFNNILEKGTYPQSWRTAIVVPIPKQNKPKSQKYVVTAQYYLSPVCKNLWENNCKKTNVGHYYKKINYVLLHLEHNVSNDLSSKNHIIILSTDFEKACAYCSSTALTTVKAFLTHRQFWVDVNTVFSNTSPCKIASRRVHS